MKKSLLKIIISLVLILCIFGCIYGVKAAVSMNTKRFFDPITINSKDIYVYCTEAGNSLASNYNYSTNTFTIDSNSSDADINNKAKKIKEIYIMCDGVTETINGEYVYYYPENKVNTKLKYNETTYNKPSITATYGGVAGFKYYAISILYSPRQIAVWGITENNSSYRIGNYSLDWNYDDTYGHISKNKFVIESGAGKLKNTNSRAGNLAVAVNNVFDSSSKMANIIRANNSATKTYIDRANDFITTIKNGIKGVNRDTSGLSAVSTTYATSYIYVGPYKINYGETLKSVKIYDTTGNEINNVDIVNSSKTTKFTDNKPTSGSTFYIRIDRNNMPNGVSKVIFTGTKTQYEFTCYDFTPTPITTYSGYQKLLGGYYRTKSSDASLTIDVNLVLLPKLKIKLYKTNDFKSDSLPGATFDITFKQNGNTIGTFTGKTAGQEVTCNQPTSDKDIYVYIKENNAPAGYQNFGTVVAVYKYDSTNQYWKFNGTASDSLVYSKQNNKDSTTLTSAEIGVINKAKLEELILKKVSLDGDKLAGAEFKVTISGGVILENDGSELGATKTVTTGPDGTVNIGAIKANNLNNAITVTLEETGAPDGYAKLTDKVSFKLKYNKSASKWEQDGNITIPSFARAALESKYLLAITKSGNTTSVSIEVPDIPNTIDELTLRKVSINGEVLENAKFKIKLENAKIHATGATSTTAATNADGNIEFGRVDVVNIAQHVTVKLTEIDAPDGYAKWANDISFNLRYNAETLEWEQEGNLTIPAFAREGLEDKYKLSITETADKKINVDIEIPDISNIFKKLIIRKVNTNGEVLENAKFKIDLTNAKIHATGATSTIATTNADGNIEFGRVDIVDIKQDVEVTLTEIEAPPGYARYNDPIIVKLKYNESDLNWDAEFEATPDFGSTALRDCYEVETRGEDGETEVDIQIPDASQIDELKVKKVDQNGNAISGAKMMITDVTNCLNPENVKGIEKTTDANGEITFGNVIASDINEKIRVTLIETQAPMGYKKIEGEIVVEYTYDSTQAKWIGEFISIPSIEKTYASEVFDLTSEELAGVSGTTCATIMVPDLAQLDDLIISKVDSQNPSMNVSGVKFEVTEIENCTNAEDILNKEFETVDGELSIGKIIFADINESLKVTLEETVSIKGYKKLSEPITIYVNYNGAADYDVTIDKGYNVEEVELEDNSNNKITISVPNIPIMLVGGIVFNDGQNGESKEGNLTVQDNVYTKIEGFDEGLAGVKVELLDESEEVVAETISAYEGDTVDYISYNGETYTKTLAKGEYFFGAIDGLDYIPRANYIVRFTYNGQKFVTTEIASDLYANNGMNKTEEIGREEFNNNFRTIPMDELEYSHTEKAEQEGCYDANLLMYEGSETSWVNNNEEEEVRELFAIKSETPDRLNLEQNWQEVWQDNGEVNEEAFQLDANCGLRERKLDISLIDDVKDVTVSINGKTTTYNYAQVIDGEVNLNGEKISDNIEEVEYNQYIYESDYYFRIENYIGGLIDNNQNVDDAAEIESAVGTQITEDDELKVNVKYQLKVNLQTMTEDGIVRVNEIKDYFDPDIYEYVGAYPCDNTNGEITIDLSSNELSKGGNHKIEIDLDFELKIPDELEDTTEGLICTGENYAEITKYSTTDGLIDRDSDPDDMGEYLEDDTDIAPAMEFKLKRNTPREMSGLVWDDTTSHDQTASYTMGNGIKDSDGDREDGINDVIVQLIEIKPIELLGTTYNLEYIWQETRTGNTKVKTMNYTNTGISEYDNSVAEDGEYEFTGFIPGNYIVRFIYGDGETYEITPKVEEYNGQDYKSTKYVDYNATEYYNEKMNSYSENTSVARDNEARRLEVMAYSVKIDNELGNAIKNKTDEMLHNTWMCSETLKINVPVDADNIETASSETTEENSLDYIVLNKINLGLELRPKTKIELEKHITGLYVQTESGQILTDAKANIDDVLDGVINSKQGVTDGLITLVSDRNFRNSWRLETDLSELGQGSELEATYTYVVKNTGDTDYLSSTLVSDYTNPLIDYSGKLNEYAREVKNAIRSGEPYVEYLGGFYYTENAAGLVEVPTQINEIQEAINNKMSFADDNTYFEKVTETDDANSAYVTNGTSEGAYKRRVWRNDETLGGIDAKSEQMNTIIKSVSGTGFMVPTDNDTSKVVNLQSTITTDGGEYESYLAEITEYTNAAGRADMLIVPENLSYVHSDDTTRTLEDVGETQINNPDEVINERDEFWGESIVITKPTGEDKVTPVQLIVTITFAVAIIGVGALVIKKFALKK